MATYQSVGVWIVQENNGALVPPDPLNCDYRDYLLQQAGTEVGIPNPAPSVATAASVSIA